MIRTYHKRTIKLKGKVNCTCDEMVARADNNPAQAIQQRELMPLSAHNQPVAVALAGAVEVPPPMDAGVTVPV